MIQKISILFFCIVSLSFMPITEYPIDGYASTGIRRLDRLEQIQKENITGTLPVKGALKTLDEIQLNLLGERGDELSAFPEPDPELQKELNRLFPNMHESYSVALLDITPGKPIAYAQRQGDRGFQPGSVGKLAIITGFMNELAKIYPTCFEARIDVMKDRFVRAGRWAMSDEHTVPFWDPETKKLVKRQVAEKDVFSLYEWCDHMLSVSNNGAASVCWREAVLMRVFCKEYATLTEERAEEYFKNTPKGQLSDTALAVINDALGALGITTDEWRLGTFFTRGAESYIPSKNGSNGTPIGLMKWMIALERGVVVDQASSLEIKRLMYMTDRRIRYAANKSLDNAAVYFKSGSLYGCKPEEGYQCAKYKGNTKNFMNSVAIIEHPDSTTYMVALMSNVLRKNSNIDHNALAGNIDKIIKARK
jgi:beta-lactamase family protein